MRLVLLEFHCIKVQLHVNPHQFLSINTRFNVFSVVLDDLATVADPSFTQTSGCCLTGRSYVIFKVFNC